MSTTPTLIADRQALQTLAQNAGAADLLAVDTEFMREKTYRAELCLLQLGDTHWQTCIDPLAVDIGKDSSWLTERWQAPECQLVMHAARQDIEVLAPRLGPPRNVFDTQIAAGLCGLPPQIGYAELARRLLGVELAKAETRTDWSRRPLTDAQIDYALDDVRYLPALRAALLTKLQTLGRGAWLAEELAGFDDASQLEVRPELAWQRLKGLQGMDPGRLQLAQQLADWRERRAMDRNRPRGWILDDSVLRAMVQEPPRDMETLRSIPEMQRGTADRVGEELLDLPYDLPPLPKRTRPDPVLEARVRQFGEVTRTVATQLEIAPEVLATRKDLELVVRGNGNAGPLNGWRRDVIGAKLLALTTVN
jgi:ribonuclease D